MVQRYHERWANIFHHYNRDERDEKGKEKNVEKKETVSLLLSLLFFKWFSLYSTHSFTYHVFFGTFLFLWVRHLIFSFGRVFLSSYFILFCQNHVPFYHSCSSSPDVYVCTHHRWRNWYCNVSINVFFFAFGATRK